MSSYSAAWAVESRRKRKGRGMKGRGEGRERRGKEEERRVDRWVEDKKIVTLIERLINVGKGRAGQDRAE